MVLFRDEDRMELVSNKRARLGLRSLALRTMARRVDVYPVSDLVPHVTGLGLCACNPAIEIVRTHGQITGVIVTHRAYDGRK